MTATPRINATKLKFFSTIKIGDILFLDSRRSYYHLTQSTREKFKHYLNVPTNEYLLERPGVTIAFVIKIHWPKKKTHTHYPFFFCIVTDPNGNLNSGWIHGEYFSMKKLPEIKTINNFDMV